ncbi:hypothetical protein RCOM_1667380 [Ricinus communis]|uniref:At2g29880-like C-terminal domain-containing protein n=1 Tax=Ricinus communis TaxID=3988 RepID=B9RL62_RICCO|nr:hypothetical protein RCOM_1667380 [Ricinus communis]
MKYGRTTLRIYRTDTFAHYEDLRIAIGNRTAIGKNATGLEEDTDAKTLEEEENRDLLNKLTHSVNKLAEAIKSYDSSEHGCWNLIKETPNLDKRARLKAFKLLNTRIKKIEFLKMTPEERYEWITYKLE